MNPSQNDSGFGYGFNGNQNFSDGSGFSNGAEFSGGSDVVLDSGGGEKKKKWPVIVLMVCVILAIGVGIASMFLGRRGEGGEKSKVDNTGLVATFNKYANYVYSGEEKDTEFKLEWNYGSVSEMKFMLDEDEDLTAKNEFFEKAKELNDNFMKVLSETYPETVDDISSRVFTLQSLSKRIDEDFGEIYDYAISDKVPVRGENETISDRELVEKYLEKLEGFSMELDGVGNEEE